MSDQDFGRALERLEAKVDRMSDAIVSLARMEERMITLFHRADRHDADQRALINRVAEVERLTLGRGHFFRWMDRGRVALLSAVVAYVISQWGGGRS